MPVKERRGPPLRPRVITSSYSYFGPIVPLARLQGLRESALGTTARAIT